MALVATSDASWAPALRTPSFLRTPVVNSDCAFWKLASVVLYSLWTWNSHHIASYSSNIIAFSLYKYYCISIITNTSTIIINYTFVQLCWIKMKRMLKVFCQFQLAELNKRLLKIKIKSQVRRNTCPLNHYPPYRSHRYTAYLD